MQEPKISPDQSKTLAATKYVKLYDLAYENGVHYYDASRRDKDQLFAFKQDPELGSALPDAVCAVIIVKEAGQEDKLLLFYEYRYPAGSYLLGLPAGLIDPADLASPDPIKTAMIREIKEETGLSIKNITYFDSQPWPYPSGLMVGFFADYESGEIKLQKDELSAGAFYHRNNLPELPRKLSIARRLIDAWLAGKDTRNR